MEPERPADQAQRSAALCRSTVGRARPRLLPAPASWVLPAPAAADPRPPRPTSRVLAPARIAPRRPAAALDPGQGPRPGACQQPGQAGPHDLRGGPRRTGTRLPNGSPTPRRQACSWTSWNSAVGSPCASTTATASGTGRRDPGPRPARTAYLAG